METLREAVKRGRNSSAPSVAQAEARLASADKAVSQKAEIHKQASGHFQREGARVSAAGAIRREGARVSAAGATLWGASPATTLGPLLVASCTGLAICHLPSICSVLYAGLTRVLFLSSLGATRAA